MEIGSIVKIKDNAGTYGEALGAIGICTRIEYIARIKTILIYVRIPGRLSHTGVMLLETEVDLI